MLIQIESRTGVFPESIVSDDMEGLEMADPVPEVDLEAVQASQGEGRSDAEAVASGEERSKERRQGSCSVHGRFWN